MTEKDITPIKKGMPDDSNTVMGVVPDSNRIPFHLLSVQLFKTVSFGYVIVDTIVTNRF